MRRVITAILFSTTLTVVFGQQVDSTSTGEVVDAEIIIQKDRQIKLPVANKLNTGAKNDKRTIQPLSLSYQAISPTFDWPEYKSEVTFERLKQEPILADYQNSLKLGFGNYSSPLFELRYFTNLSATRISSQFFHESFQEGPVAGKNSASSETSAKVAVDYKTKSLILKPMIEWQRNGFRYYGNTNRINSGFSSEELEKISRGHVDFGFMLKGGNENLNFSIEPHFYTTDQSVQDGPSINSESGFRFNTGLDLKVDDGFTVGFDLDGNLANYKSGVEYNRSLYSITPWIARSGENWSFKGGFGFYTMESFLTDQDGLYLFADAEMKLNENWSVYGNLNGGVDWNSLNDILALNQFMDDSLIVENTLLIPSVGGGIKGSLTNNLSVQSGIEWRSVENMPFFVPSVSDSSRFSLTYDTETTNILSFRSNIQYATSTNTIFGIAFNLFNYQTNTLEKAWHLPSYTVELSFSKNVKEKFFINSEIIARGGIEAPGSTAIEVIELDSFLDVNLNLDYKATERFSVFLKLNNLLNKEYENYIGYPVRGAAFKVGGKYRF